MGVRAEERVLEESQGHSCGQRESPGRKDGGAGRDPAASEPPSPLTAGRLLCHSRDRDYNDIDDDDPFNPQARRIAAYMPSRGRLPSFCSYSGSLDSQPGLPPPAQTVSNAPVSEYMYGRAPGPPPPPPAPGRLAHREIRLQVQGAK